MAKAKTPAKTPAKKSVAKKAPAKKGSASDVSTNDDPEYKLARSIASDSLNYVTSRMSEIRESILQNWLDVGDVLNRWSGTPFTCHVPD